MSSENDDKLCLFVYPYVSSTPILSRYSSQSFHRRENDIERLKRRIDLLVKSNDEKEKKIENLQVQLKKYQKTNFDKEQLPNRKENDFNINNNSNHPKSMDSIEKNSLMSLRIDNDLSELKEKCLFSSTNSYNRSINSHQNPLNKLKLDVLYRASSAEPTVNCSLTNTPNNNALIKTRTYPLNEYRSLYNEQNGYISDEGNRYYSTYKTSSSSNLDKSKSSSVKGLKHLFGKLIRTNSGNLREDNQEKSQNVFRRGGLRATINNGKASSKATLRSLETRFSHWQLEQAIIWLHSIGLGQYASECRKYFKSGLQLIQATSQDLEKKLNMRNPLHRKKLQLYLNDLCTQQAEAHGLDTYWVQKWLDDIGLPQYKEYFLESKVDGRVLNNITFEDILYLNITNEVHQLCLKRSIQVLRLTNFNSSSIKRRPNPNDKNDINEIMYWSNHRVMEWLRSVDLSEYAPNLRGSGVCGALIVLEIRFNVSTLAEILSIPLSKTLLRRHLSMRFQELIGYDLQNRKNQYEKSSDYQQLTSLKKLKFSRGLFNRRRTRSNVVDDLVCPMEENHIPVQIQSDTEGNQVKELKLIDSFDSELLITQNGPTTIV